MKKSKFVALVLIFALFFSVVDVRPARADFFTEYGEDIVAILELIADIATDNGWIKPSMPEPEPKKEESSSSWWWPFGGEEKKTEPEPKKSWWWPF